MNILGIETSCDETAASVVTDGRFILSNVISSSLARHQKYGGIIPEIASRRQLEYIQGVVQQALQDSHLTTNEIDAIAVTQKPGLIGSLLVGLSFARALSFAQRKPLVLVDHIQAHLYANFLTDVNKKEAAHDPSLPKLPAVGLVVSGGHSSLFLVRNFSNITLLGQTRDDAVGEAFDKVAKILNLGYPGGPIIDRLAQKGRNNEIRFPCADLPGSFDFSFSGIKTAVLYYAQAHMTKEDFSVEKVAYAFQQSVTKVLVDKCFYVCRKKKIRSLLIGGGVAANSSLRQQLWLRAKEEMIDVHFPPPALCLDNAAMGAGMGFHLAGASAAQAKPPSKLLRRAKSFVRKSRKEKGGTP